MCSSAHCPQSTRCPSTRICAVGHVLNEVFEGLVESSLQQPTFVLDHPLEISPLVRDLGWLLRLD